MSVHNARNSSGWPTNIHKPHPCTQHERRASWSLAILWAINGNRHAELTLTVPACCASEANAFTRPDNRVCCSGIYLQAHRGP